MVERGENDICIRFVMKRTIYKHIHFSFYFSHFYFSYPPPSISLCLYIQSQGCLTDENMASSFVALRITMHRAKALHPLPNNFFAQQDENYEVLLYMCVCGLCIYIR